MSEPTTIHWLTLPRNGNGGAAIVSWDHGAFKYMKAPDYLNPPSIEYLLGFKPPRYTVPAINQCAWCAAPPPQQHDGWHEVCTWGGCPY